MEQNKNTADLEGGLEIEYIQQKIDYWTEQARIVDTQLMFWQNVMEGKDV